MSSDVGAGGWFLREVGLERTRKKREPGKNKQINGIQDVFNPPHPQ